MFIKMFEVPSGVLVVFAILGVISAQNSMFYDVRNIQLANRSEDVGNFQIIESGPRIDKRLYQCKVKGVNIIHRTTESELRNISYGLLRDVHWIREVRSDRRVETFDTHRSGINNRFIKREVGTQKLVDNKRKLYFERLNAWLEQVNVVRVGKMNRVRTTENNLRFRLNDQVRNSGKSRSFNEDRTYPQINTPKLRIIRQRNNMDSRSYFNSRRTQFFTRNSYRRVNKIDKSREYHESDVARTPSRSEAFFNDINSYKENLFVKIDQMNYFMIAVSSLFMYDFIKEITQNKQK